MKPIDRREFMKLAGAAPVGLAALGRPDAAPSRTAPGGDADARLEIDLKNIAWNLEQIRNKVERRPVMAVIKANAYGHGLVEVGRFLERERVRFLAVGKAREAFALRDGGVNTPILNFGPFSRVDAGQIVRRDVSQSVYTGAFRHLAAAARKLDGAARARVHVKVDTGLGRVGVPHHRALALIEEVASTPGLTIEGIFTTFTEDEAFDRVQLERFLRVCRAARQKGIDIGLRHAASSAGVLSLPEAHLDMVRPGIMLYGHYPSAKAAKARTVDLRPAMSMKVPVAYVKALGPGDGVSYHRAFVAGQETRVATLPVGYSDGYPYQAAGKAEVLVRERRRPAIALVTANHLTVDVTGDDAVRIGDEAILFGRQGEAEISAAEVAAWAGTSVYKILIGMSPLLPRRFA